MPLKFTTRPWLVITAITIIAGITYCSWPLGNWLNPIVNRGLASDLEAIGQPYNWLFIGLDIFSGLLISIATYWLLMKLKRRKAWLIKVGLIGFGAFGLLTAIDAVLPLNCVSTIQKCGSIWDDPYFIIHGIASIGSIAGLTVSIVTIWWLLARDVRTNLSVRLLLHSTMLVWFGFGLLTMVLILLNRTSGNAQHAFIVICSAWTAIVPYVTHLALIRKPITTKTV